MKFYGYDNCSTCKKAEKFLKNKGVTYEKFDITLNPPDEEALLKILKESDYKIKDLFNTSGVLYREMNMKDKINDTKEDDLISLLAKHGKLIKRPILINRNKFAVGFKEEIFNQVIN